MAVLGTILLGLYFLPLIVAAMRSHAQTGPIAVVNILLGWTLVGWVAAMAWACTTPQPPIIQTITAAPAPPKAPSGSVADEIAAFARLRDSGAITASEYEAKKAQLLALTTPPALESASVGAPPVET
jgi:hypothetical protein